MSKVSRYSVTSSLLKVLVSLKILHGGKAGSKGATLEEISMHMVKTYDIDGDIKSQVLASLKYGVKLNLIEKKIDKFMLIIPGSGVHLATCKQKCEEAERVNCIYPPIWEPRSVCGKRKRKGEYFSCYKEDKDQECPHCPCQQRKQQQQQCSPPPPSKCRKTRPCPRPSCAPRKSPCGNKPCGDMQSNRSEYCGKEKSSACNACYDGGEDDDEDEFANFPQVPKYCSCCYK